MPDYDLLKDTGIQYDKDTRYLSSMSENIAAMVEEISATVNQVGEAVNNMSVMAQTTTGSAEVIKEGLDDTTNSINEINQASENQATVAQNLNEIVQKFII